MNEFSRRDAYSPFLVEEGGAGFGEGAVVLADVDAVGTDFSGEGGEIIEDEGDSGGTAKWEDFLGDAADGGEVVVFRAELENIRAAGE